MEHEHPGDLNVLHEKADLSLEDTRTDSGGVAAVCACGDELGASYYAFSHNLVRNDDTPILIEFEAERSACAVDGMDFLYTAFQLGDPDRARPVLERVFGKAVLRYADRAWVSDDQEFRIAQCDLAIHDPKVIQAHYANDLVLGGRHGTVFRNAFTITLPVGSESIKRVWAPSEFPALAKPEVSLNDVRLVSRA